MSAYSALAAAYDRLNGDADYDAYLSLILSHLPKSDASVLDLGCGTGELAIRLANCGFRTLALDKSIDMLAIASKKAQKSEIQPFFINQDMSSFRLYAPVDLVFSAYDCLNYLPDPATLEATFSRVFNALNDGGVFIFDVNSHHRYKDVYKDNTFIMEEDGVFISWENFYNAKNKTCDFYLHIFVEDPPRSGNYRRSFEQQRQRYFPLSTLKKLLTKAGFSDICVYSSLDLDPLTKQTESYCDKYYFIVKK